MKRNERMTNDALMSPGQQQSSLSAVPLAQLSQMRRITQSQQGSRRQSQYQKQTFRQSWQQNPRNASNSECRNTTVGHAQGKAKMRSVMEKIVASELPNTSQYQSAIFAGSHQIESFRLADNKANVQARNTVISGAASQRRSPREAKTDAQSLADGQLLNKDMKNLMTSGAAQVNKKSQHIQSIDSSMLNNKEVIPNQR